jgi:hypothetical protein
VVGNWNGVQEKRRRLRRTAIVQRRYVFLVRSELCTAETKARQAAPGEETPYLVGRYHFLSSDKEAVDRFLGDLKLLSDVGEFVGRLIQPLTVLRTDVRCLSFSTTTTLRQQTRSPMTLLSWRFEFKPIAPKDLLGKTGSRLLD